MNFHEMGIPNGAILRFERTGDEARVIGPRKVSFRGREMSITGVTKIILNVDSNSIPTIASEWFYQGECLRDIRDRWWRRGGYE